MRAGQSCSVHVDNLVSGLFQICPREEVDSVHCLSSADRGLEDQLIHGVAGKDIMGVVGVKLSVGGGR